ncbi:MAG: hypothetical protein KJZ57_11300, partial [Anaerolineales bacterium]|nr:hypothetical protein [Anaerolineales bacterium]
MQQSQGILNVKAANLRNSQPRILFPTRYRTWQESSGSFIANGANNASFAAARTKSNINRPFAAFVIE